MTNGIVEEILKETDCLVFPGVFDTLSAKIAERVGFPMAFISGYSVAATAIGEPDFGLLTQTEMLERARNICKSVDIPILVDADTGYGNPLNVHRTVGNLIDAGAAGCFLEDQVWPKKCGHMRGKQVIAKQDYVDKIRAAVDARGENDFFIVSRTDALAVTGIDEAIERVQAARACGASASFVEAPENIEQLRQIGARSPGPNVANMIEGGRTPVLSRSELRDLGFQLVLYPLTGLYSAARTIDAMYRMLLETGTTAGAEDRLMSFGEFNELIQLEEKYSLAQRFGV